jgi:hypothetical protein
MQWLAERANVVNHHVPMSEKISTNEEYVIESLRQVTAQDDHDARSEVQECLSEVVSSWLHNHPNREAACRLDSEEHYVAFAFERFWRLTIDQQIEFSTLTAASR